MIYILDGQKFKLALQNTNNIYMHYAMGLKLFQNIFFQ